MNEKLNKRIESMSYDELEEYVTDKKYSKMHVDFYNDVIEEKNKLIDELLNICEKENKYIKDIVELKDLAEDLNVSYPKIELINKKLQQLATQIR